VEAKPEDIRGRSAADVDSVVPPTTLLATFAPVHRIPDGVAVITAYSLE